MKFLSKLSKETLTCVELKVKDYKEILKCSLGDEPNKLIFVETICEILSNVTNKSLDYIKNLNIIDLFCLLLDVRANSLGECKLILTQDEIKFNIELDLNTAKEQTMSLFDQLTTTIKHNKMEIIFECPSINRLMQHTNDDYLSYIKGATITKNRKKRFIEINTNEQAEMFFDKLSPKTSLQIIHKFNEFVTTVTGLNYLSHYGFKDQQLVFLPSLDSLIWFVKLMFSEPLGSVYENIFYLGYTGKMDAQYVENIAVGEYNYFIGLLRQAMAAKNQSQQTNEQTINNDPGFFEDPF